MSQAASIADRALRPCPIDCCVSRGCTCEEDRAEGVFYLDIPAPNPYLLTMGPLPVPPPPYNAALVIPFNVAENVKGDLSLDPLTGIITVGHRGRYYVGFNADVLPTNTAAIGFFFDLYVNQNLVQRARLGSNMALLPTTGGAMTFQVAGGTILRVEKNGAQIAIQFYSTTTGTNGQFNGSPFPPPALTMFRLGD